MSENGDVIIVRHVVTEKIHISPKHKKKDVSEDKWCWTRIKEARNKSGDNTRQCFGEVLQILLESCGALMLFLLENLFGIIFLILGIIFVNDCPISQAIPISLIVFGAFSIIHGIILQLIRWRCVDMDKESDGVTTLTQVIILVSTLINMLAFLLANAEPPHRVVYVRSVPTTQQTRNPPPTANNQLNGAQQPSNAVQQPPNVVQQSPNAVQQPPNAVQQPPNAVQQSSNTVPQEST